MMVTPPSIELSAAGLEPLVIPSGTLGIRQLDVGHPVPRIVSDGAPGIDGEIDRTRLFGARAITVELRHDPRRVVNGGNVWDQAQRLRSYLSPARRSLMRFRDLPEYPPDVCAVVRGSPLASVLGLQGAQLGVTYPVVQWSAPTGILESVETHTARARLVSLDTVPGFSYPLTYPLTYPPAPISGTTDVRNVGSVLAWPRLYVRGPITDPLIANLNARPDDPTDPVRFLWFKGTTIAAGAYLEIDTRARTANLNGVPGASLLQYLTRDSRWWGLQPDDLQQLIRLTDDGGGGAAGSTAVDIEWQDAYL